MPGFGGDLGGVEAGTQRRGGTCYRQTPQGLTGTWVQSKGGKGGVEPARGKVADAGMRRGAQGRAAEADGWRVRATSKWAALHAGRGGGYNV